MVDWSTEMGTKGYRSGNTSGMLVEDIGHNDTGVGEGVGAVDVGMGCCGGA